MKIDGYCCNSCVGNFIEAELATEIECKIALVADV